MVQLSDTLKTKRLWLIAVVVVFLLLPVSGVVLADCSSSDGGANVRCDGNDDDVRTGAGDNNITVESGATVRDDGFANDTGNTPAQRNNDDAINAGFGNDTVTNDGRVLGDIEGDRGNFDDGPAGGNPGDGNDTITNNNLVTDDIQGEGGDDTITNNGRVGDDVEGGPGSDTLNNNGLVVEDVEGGPGSDTLNNSSTGRVGNDVDGGGGNDDVDNEGRVGDDVVGGAGSDNINNTGIVVENIYGDQEEDCGPLGCFGQEGDDVINNSGQVDTIFGDIPLSERECLAVICGPLDARGGDDDITNTGIVNNIFAGPGDDNVTIDSDSTVNGLIGGGTETNGDTLTFRVRTNADRNAVNAIDNPTDPTVITTITFSNGNSFAWRNFESLLAVLLGRGSGGDTDEEEVEFTPIKLYDDLKYLVVFIGEDGLDFYRYDSPENLEGIGLGVVPYGDITGAVAPETIFETTTEDGYTLQVIVPEDGELAFNLFLSGSDSPNPSLAQTANGSQLVDAVIEYE